MDEPPPKHDPVPSDAAPPPVDDGVLRTPTVDHTSLPPELWLEIFRYATHVPRARSIAPGDPLLPEKPVDYARGMNSPIQSMRTKCALVRVCHVWKAIATELLYEHVVLGSAQRIENLCKALRESRREIKHEDGTLQKVDDPGYGQWVRHLEVRRWARSHQTQFYWQAIIRAVSYCSRLRVFSGVWQEPLPEGFLPVLVQYLPPSLQELFWQQDSVLIVSKELPVLASSALTKFSTLRILDLRKICILDAGRSLQHITFESLTFPHVTHLALPTCPLLLRYASKQVMPELCHLVLDASGAPRTVHAPFVTKELVSFLDAYGHQLRTVELLPSNTQSMRPGPINISAFLSPSACPNLETLVFDSRTPSAVNLAPYNASVSSAPPLEEPHPTLRRVGIRGIGVNQLYPNKPTHAQAHLEAFAAYRVFFPALELVRTLGFLVGTSTDPFAPDVFIWWTEMFERVGVDLQDGEGVVWMLEEAPAPAPAAPSISTGANGESGQTVPKAQDLGGCGAKKGQFISGVGGVESGGLQEEELKKQRIAFSTGV
ncbi:hypothetical protein L226DRAFT_457363 [Lentinus tigrinus ALCF2SS1-7]|uniref:uncharacterized protein n=1 Tax=Lentinus tigrinus ALCF2SS1-7 TaxID=1328758 RepID=UPI001165FCBD|nr:hypothetical protein L226DRAFT_457363 [Lentinus tigrinus ALCF2SS1-7]